MTTVQSISLDHLSVPNYHSMFKSTLIVGLMVAGVTANHDSCVAAGKAMVGPFATMPTPGPTLAAYMATDLHFQTITDECVVPAATGLVESEYSDYFSSVSSWYVDNNQGLSKMYDECYSHQTMKTPTTTNDPEYKSFTWTPYSPHQTYCSELVWERPRPEPTWAPEVANLTTDGCFVSNNVNKEIFEKARKTMEKQLKKHKKKLRKAKDKHDRWMSKETDKLKADKKKYKVKLEKEMQEQLGKEFKAVSKARARLLEDQKSFNKMLDDSNAHIAEQEREIAKVLMEVQWESEKQRLEFENQAKKLPDLTRQVINENNLRKKQLGMCEKSVEHQIKTTEKCEKETKKLEKKLEKKEKEKIKLRDELESCHDVQTLEQQKAADVARWQEEKLNLLKQLEKLRATYISQEGEVAKMKEQFYDARCDARHYSGISTLIRGWTRPPAKTHTTIDTWINKGPILTRGSDSSTGTHEFYWATSSAEATKTAHPDD